VTIARDSRIVTLLYAHAASASGSRAANHLHRFARLDAFFVRAAPDRPRSVENFFARHAARSRSGLSHRRLVE
jgi:hypothetical protein